jgi:hypothetical protein
MDCQRLLETAEQPGYHQCLPKERKTWFFAQIYWNKTQLFLGKERDAPAENTNHFSSWLKWMQNNSN